MPYLITAFLIILLGSTFGIESLSSLQVWSMTFSQQDKVNFSPNKMFLTVKAVNVEIKANENFGDSHVDNILRPFNSWTNLPLNISEMTHDY